VSREKKPTTSSTHPNLTALALLSTEKTLLVDTSSALGNGKPYKVVAA